MFEVNSEFAMKKIMSGFIALAMSLPLGMTGNASALPRVETSVPSAVQQVQTNQGQFPGSFRSVNPDRQFSPWAGDVDITVDIAAIATTGRDIVATMTASGIRLRRS
jgi:hypothetical protein